MRPMRALMATLALGGVLVWGYCVLRIVTGGFPFSDEFIIGIPVTFLDLSILAFVTFLAAFFCYLVLEERASKGENL
jgi:hypothetical protein